MTKDLIIPEVIEQKIYVIHKQKVMLDEDLAMLYGVPVKRLNEQVKRNKKRFPKDFMFMISQDENIFLRSQFATANKGRGGRRNLPYAFTELGVAMLSSVLNSERAIQVNIEIMRTFIKIREILLTHKELKKKIDEMEKKYDNRFRLVFETLKKMMTQEEIPKNKIGFRLNKEKDK
jgi:hypothetical protein